MSNSDNHGDGGTGLSNNQTELPQTNDNGYANKQTSMIGLLLITISGLLGLVGLKKRRKL
ncbi:hypothetical protein FD41_GL001161 [Lentilactobacillus farraginis DSM 18382 = JCM 14108]|uniref:Gram-positive cocci surface proteins LPxTG domain-containing protein n=1 Tax=Lentilactobacillus farraginis DSM 18382 = JCM 14108 TaxID=1423743 RepID=X0PMR1_9LACO|nr:hypothetical protein FD41_GL001161 [Lentilactobacillus farraginis DSM 18382 = JCM 14108]GAF38156.1 hypothetical protein JCM14108_3268 [Lentilactobacillus farraginis DSM 18382 = JCM 14108]